MKNAFSRPIILCLVALAMGAALGAAVLGDMLYTQHVEADRCYRYARQKRLPNLEHLEFSSVVVAGKYNNHGCWFVDRSSGGPVPLEFDPLDSPSNLPHVLSMAIPFLVIGYLGWTLVARAQRGRGARRH